MPGENFIESTKTVLGSLPDLAFVPELPARGVQASMIGRSLALITQLPIDLQPAGWRLASGDGADHRRAQSLLARDLDELEEVLGEYNGALKQQVAGPLTLAATVEKLRGDKVLADHGARRELAEALADGVSEHTRELVRRFPDRDIHIQVDEPGINAVLGGAVPTASGFGRHRVVHPPEASALLSLVVEGIEAAGAVAVVHSCAAQVPASLLATAGFRAISFDLSLVTPDDDWSEVFESGIDLWPGGADNRGVEKFMHQLGFEPESYVERLVVTPACGLASSSVPDSRRILAEVQSVASSW